MKSHPGLTLINKKAFFKTIMLLKSPSVFRRTPFTRVLYESFSELKAIHFTAVVFGVKLCLTLQDFDGFSKRNYMLVVHRLFLHQCKALANLNCELAAVTCTFFHPD